MDYACLNDVLESLTICKIGTLHDFSFIEDCEYRNVQGDTSFINNVEAAIENWEQYYKQFNKNFIASIDIQLFERWADVLRKDERRNREDGHNFNIFDLLKICHVRLKEVNHSRLLKFLLEPNKIHGQGNLFLHKFLTKLGVCLDRTDEWTVRTEQGNIDILLERAFPQSTIIIENKSNWANDQPNQLYRYWYYAIYMKTKQSDKSYYNREEQRSRFRIVYLSPNESKQPDNQTKERPEEWDKDLPALLPMTIDNITFCDWISCWIDECIEDIPKSNHALRNFLIQYRNLCFYL